MKSKTAKELRICRLCDEEKAIDLFEVDNRVKGGYTTRCKQCKNGLDNRSNSLYRGLKYRAKQDEQPLEVTLLELQSLFAIFEGKCVYCDATEEDTGRSHHVDHIIAASKGGRHHRSNLVLSCDPCNRQKGNRPFLEFYKRKKDEISDENYSTLIHYVAIMSEQPLREVFTDFMLDYIEENHEILGDILGDELRIEVSKIAEDKIQIDEAS